MIIPVLLLGSEALIGCYIFLWLIKAEENSYFSNVFWFWWFFCLVKYLKTYGSMRKGKGILGDEKVANHCFIACLTLFVFTEKVIIR